MRKTFQIKEAVNLLRKKQGDRSLRQFARDLGVSKSYLSEVFSGGRNPGEKLLKQVGLTQAIIRA